MGDENGTFKRFLFIYLFFFSLLNELDFKKDYRLEKYACMCFETKFHLKTQKVMMFQHTYNLFLCIFPPV